MYLTQSNSKHEDVTMLLTSPAAPEAWVVAGESQKGPSSPFWVEGELFGDFLERSSIPYTR
jgi:hypothetical protein